MSLLPAQPSMAEAAFEFEAGNLKERHPILKVNEDAASWFFGVTLKLRAYIALNHGNEWASLYKGDFPNLPEGLSEEETVELNGLLAELKKVADYQEPQKIQTT